VLTNVSPLSWEAAGSPAASQLSVSQRTNRRRVTRPPGVTGINVARRHPPVAEFPDYVGLTPDEPAQTVWVLVTLNRVVSAHG